MDEKIAELERRIELIENKLRGYIIVGKRDKPAEPGETEKMMYNAVMRALNDLDYRKANDDTGVEST